MTLVIKTLALPAPTHILRDLLDGVVLLVVHGAARAGRAQTGVEGQRVDAVDVALLADGVVGARLAPDLALVEHGVLLVCMGVCEAERVSQSSEHEEVTSGRGATHR